MGEAELKKALRKSGGLDALDEGGDYDRLPSGDELGAALRERLDDHGSDGAAERGSVARVPEHQRMSIRERRLETGRCRNCLAPLPVVVCPQRGVVALPAQRVAHPLRLAQPEAVPDQLG